MFVFFEFEFGFVFRFWDGLCVYVLIDRFSLSLWVGVVRSLRGVFSGLPLGRGLLGLDSWCLNFAGFLIGLGFVGVFPWVFEVLSVCYVEGYVLLFVVCSFLLKVVASLAFGLLIYVGLRSLVDVLRCSFLDA